MDSAVMIVPEDCDAAHHDDRMDDEIHDMLDMTNRSDTEYAGNTTAGDIGAVSDLSLVQNGTLSIIEGRNKVTFVKDNLTGMYKCHCCTYETLYRSSMKSHYAVHSNARPYACDLCEYEAKRLCDLKKHKVLRHGKSLKSLRKNKWRGALGGAAYRGEQGTNSGENDQENDELSPVKISVTRSGIPIEIIDDEDEDDTAADDEIDFNTSVHESEELDDTNGPTLSESSDNSFRLKNTTTNPDHVQHQNKSPIFIKKEPEEETSASRSGDNQENSDIESMCLNIVNNISVDSGHASSPTIALNKKRTIPSVGMAAQSPGTKIRKTQNDIRMYAKSVHQNTSTPNSQSSLCSEGMNLSLKSWTCIHCKLVFYDNALYFMHKGLHSEEDPWKCTICGQSYHDVYGFTSHFVNGHSK